MKSVPKTTTLGGHRITVRRVSGLLDAGLNGQANWDDKEIRIDASLSGAALGEVFLHECVHMVASCYGLEIDEHMTRILGVGLQQMIGLRPK